MSAPLRPYPSHSWLWITSIWLGVGLVDAAQTVFIMRAAGMHHDWIKLFVVTVLFWSPWALATGPVVHLGRRYPPSLRASPAAWSAHLAACAVIGLVFTAWITWLERFFDIYAGSENTGPFVHLWLNRYFNGILSSLVLYSGILAISYLVESRVAIAGQQLETARLNEQLVNAQLDALRSQIEPHFLFNSLNAISGLVRAGSNDDAVNAIAGLSDFLRHTLTISARLEVPLSEELKFTTLYLEIQKIRFAERLQVRVAVPHDLQDASVPGLILQPIVENAVKHGISKRLQGGMIQISASRSGETLNLTVFNDGPKLPATATDGGGIGSANVRSRLSSLYGNAFAFSMCNAPAGGVEVSLSLPYRTCTLTRVAG